MNPPDVKDIEQVAGELFVNHLFNPTDKTQWIEQLIKDGLTEIEAKRAFKIAAIKYHAHRNELSNKKQTTGQTLAKVAGAAGAGFFTFFVGPWIYFALVLLVITILGFIFGF